MTNLCDLALENNARILDQYQDFTDEVSLYPEAGEGTRLALSYASLELGDESGEVQGKIKKLLRGDYELDEAKKAEIAKELGDVLFAVARVAIEIDYDLFTVMKLNVDKLRYRAMANKIQGDGDNR